MKGHGFNRAVAEIESQALAPEGWFFEVLIFLPQANQEFGPGLCSRQGRNDEENEGCSFVGILHGLAASRSIR